MTAHRVQMELPESSIERLERLRTLTGAGSFADVMSNALRLYEYAVHKSTQGTPFLIQEGGKSPAALKLFADGEP